MSINYCVQNGKIIKSEVPKILTLVNHYLEAFHYNYSRVQIENDLTVYESNEDSGQEMLLQKAKLCALSRQIFYYYAFDIYEFFYIKREPELGEYFYFQFPLDIKKFEKERVPEAKIKKLLENKNNLDTKIVDYIKQTSDTFFKCLKCEKE